MKIILLSILTLSLSTLYGCGEKISNYSNKSADDGLTAEKIFNKTNEGIKANNEANQQLQELDKEIK